MLGRGNFFFGNSALFPSSEDAIVMALFFETLGWIGTMTLIVAYVLLSWGKVLGTRLSYQFMQLFGAVCLGSSGFYKGFFQAPVLEIFWFIIGCFAIRRILNKRKEPGPR